MSPAASVRAERQRVAHGRRAWRWLPLVALLATGGCFATRNDVRIVQADVASLRTEMLKSDAALRDQLSQSLKLLAVANDSLAKLSARTVGTQGDVRGEMRAVKDQLSQVQTLIMQLQSTITRFRSDIEERTSTVAPPVVSSLPPSVSGPPTGGSTSGNAGGVVDPTKAAAPDSTRPAPRGPGPTQLYSDAKAQQRRGSLSTARTLFQELLSTYPNSDLAPDAQEGLAQLYEAEKNLAAADAAYGAVLTKYPDTPVAPRALYKRAMIALQQGNKAEARKLFGDVISRYPKSDEADLAAEQLKTLR